MTDALSGWTSVLALSLGSPDKIARAREGLEVALSANVGPGGDAFEIRPRSSQGSDDQLLVHVFHSAEDRGLKLAQALSDCLREQLGEVAVGVGTMRTGEHPQLRLTKMADLALYMAQEEGPLVVRLSRDLLERFGRGGPAGSLARLRPGDPPRPPRSPLDQGATPEERDKADEGSGSA